MQENTRHPVIPLAMQRMLPANAIEALQPYQVLYNSIMMHLEQVVVQSRQVGRTTHQENILAQADEVRRSAERAVGISRERQGRINEYPLTPNEAFQYRVGVDPYRTGYQHDEGDVFSVQHRRQDGIWEQVHSERVTNAQRQGRTLHEMIEEAFYTMPQPRERQIVIHTSEAGARLWEEAARQFAQETERAMWYGTSTTRITRRDKKKVVTTSIYWEYQPFD